MLLHHNHLTPKTSFFFIKLIISNQIKDFLLENKIISFSDTVNKVQRIFSSILYLNTFEHNYHMTPFKIPSEPFENILPKVPLKRKYIVICNTLYTSPLPCFMSKSNEFTQTFKINCQQGYFNRAHKLIPQLRPQIFFICIQVFSRCMKQSTEYFPSSIFHREKTALSMISKEHLYLLSSLLYDHIHLPYNINKP